MLSLYPPLKLMPSSVWRPLKEKLPYSTQGSGTLSFQLVFRTFFLLLADDQLLRCNVSFALVVIDPTIFKSSAVPLIFSLLLPLRS